MNYPVVHKPRAVFDAYYKARDQRAITSLDQFPKKHLWKLEEVKETLLYSFGNMMQYWLVSSWVNGGYITPECSEKWKALKKRKQTWDGRYTYALSGRKKYSDFDIVMKWPNGLNVAMLTADNEFNRIRFGMATKSGLLIDIYPEKETEIGTGILLNPEQAEIQEQQATYKSEVPRYE